MLLVGIVAATFMGVGCTLVAADTRVVRGATYTFYRWRRRQRARWLPHAARSVSLTKRSAAQSKPGTGVGLGHSIP
jgi:hypothetical protein